MDQSTPQSRHDRERAELKAWIERQLAKPGGHGPLPREAVRVLTSLHANRDRRPSPAS